MSWQMMRKEEMTMANFCCQNLGFYFVTEHSLSVGNGVQFLSFVTSCLEKHKFITFQGRMQQESFWQKRIKSTADYFPASEKKRSNRLNMGITFSFRKSKIQTS